MDQDREEQVSPAKTTEAMLDCFAKNVKRETYLTTWEPAKNYGSSWKNARLVDLFCLSKRNIRSEGLYFEVRRPPDKQKKRLRKKPKREAAKSGDAVEKALPLRSAVASFLFTRCGLFRSLQPWQAKYHFTRESYVGLERVEHSM